MVKDWIFCIIIFTLLITTAILLIRHNRGFDIRFVEEPGHNLKTPIRIIQISDLHERNPGRTKDELPEMINYLKPDLVVSTGDMVSGRNGADTGPFIRLLKQINAPVIGVTGNHESHMLNLHQTVKVGRQMVPINDLRDYAGIFKGCRLLFDEGISINIHGVRVGIFGIVKHPGTAPKEFLDSLDKFNANDYDIKVMITHYPNYLQLASEKGFDLMLAGHWHGGQWLLPGKIPVLTPGHGFFYKGYFEDKVLGSTRGIVSRGLGDHTKIPRINNRHELIVIDIK